MYLASPMEPKFVDGCVDTLVFQYWNNMHGAIEAHARPARPRDRKLQHARLRSVVLAAWRFTLKARIVSCNDLLRKEEQQRRRWL